jgi:hypothetical protein
LEPFLAVFLAAFFFAGAFFLLLAFFLAGAFFLLLAFFLLADFFFAPPDLAARLEAGCVEAELPSLAATVPPLDSAQMDSSSSSS